EQTTVYASLLDHRQGEVSQLTSDSLSGGQLFGLDFFQFSTTRFEFLNGGFGSTTSNTLGDQIITGITVAHTHDIAKIAQVGDFFKQNNLHDCRPRISCGYRCKAAGPGSGRA